MPFWPIMGINLNTWQNFIKPTSEFRLHRWFPDVMMHFNKENYPCLILPDLYCLNNQPLKKKYNILWNSADSNKDSVQSDKYFGAYGPHLSYFKKKWGWDYELVKWTLTPSLLKKYRGSYIEKFYNHDVRKKGPLKIFNFGNY